MPGAYHTEVVKEKEGYRVYLIDINWKNPSVLDSDVKASIQFGKNKSDLNCTKELDSYLCKSSGPDKGELTVLSKREGQIGSLATYKLPLKFQSNQNDMPDHKSHH